MSIENQSLVDPHRFINLDDGIRGTRIDALVAARTEFSDTQSSRPIWRKRHVREHFAEPQTGSPILGDQHAVTPDLAQSRLLCERGTHGTTVAMSDSLVPEAPDEFSDSPRYESHLHVAHRRGTAH